VQVWKVKVSVEAVDVIQKYSTLLERLLPLDLQVDRIGSEYQSKLWAVSHVRATPQFRFLLQ
jgi:hypothetical protein